MVCFTAPLQMNIQLVHVQSIRHVLVFLSFRQWFSGFADQLSGVNSKKDDVEKANLLVKKSPLKFSASDIKYIIVKSEKEIPDFVEYIEKDLAHRFPNEKERKLLVSKLISVDQIDVDV